MLTILSHLGRDRSGVGTVEFALIFPVFMTLFFGVVEYSKYNMETRRAQMAVDAAADYLSRDDDGMLKVSERQIVEDIWMIMNPTSYLATQLTGNDRPDGYARAFASVRFNKETGCGTDCGYEPEVLWSLLVKSGTENPVSTACELTVVTNSTALDGSNIREGSTGRSAVVIADFTYPYKPLLEGWLLPAKELHVNAIKRTRSGSALDYAGNDSIVTRCN